MKYLCHVTAPILTTIDAGNLRGEPRWERNAFAAWLKTGRSVHTTKNVWNTQEEKPHNLYDGFNPEWKDDSILITHGCSEHTYITRESKYYIVQYFNTPAINQNESFMQYHRQKPGCILATCSYQSWTYLKDLQRAFGPENVECVFGPSVPYVVDNADNFTKPLLFWSHRNFLEFSRYNLNVMREYTAKISDFLTADLSLRFVINICTAGQWEVLDKVLREKTDFVMAFPFMSPLIKHKDRIDVVSNIAWTEVLDIMSKTRLIVSPPTQFSAVASEAPMFGIPVVLSATANPFQDVAGNKFFPEVVTCPDGIGRSFIEKLESLFSDYSFYRSCGNAYREYIRNNATYDAYTKRIDLIVEKRGWV